MPRSTMLIGCDDPGVAMSERVSIHGMWSSPLAFVLAAAGSAIGLGNVWRFPYLAGENGGGAFLLIYLLCLALVGLPLLMTEVMLGRRGRASPVHTLRELTAEAGLPRLWVLLGWSGMLAGVLVLSYYSVIAGWALAYVFKTAHGTLSGLTAEGVSSIFSEFIASPEKVLAWHTIFVAMNVIVVSRGVRAGLEQANRLLLPLLLLLLLALDMYAYDLPGFERGLRLVFIPDWGKLSANGVLMALGHALFSLSLGVGAMMVYGAYLPAEASILRTSLQVVVLDTLVALLAALAILPLLFTSNLAITQGPGLVFQTLPVSFGHLPYGALFGTLFYGLLVIVAWTSGIALMEPAVAWLVEQRQMGRVRAAALAGIVIWLLGIATLLSFSEWRFSFGFLGMVKRGGIFDLLDILTAGFLVPLGGLALLLFATRCLPRATLVEALGMGDGPLFRSGYFLTRYVAPAAVIVVFLHGLGAIQPVIRFVQGLFSIPAVGVPG